MKKSQFIKIIKEEIHNTIKEMIIKEAAIMTKKEKGLQKMSEKETSFSGWANKYAKEITKTEGDKNELFKMINSAREKEKLNISDKFYNYLVRELGKARNDTSRLYSVYNMMFKPRGWGVN